MDNIQTHFNNYLNWLPRALLGQLAEADSIMQTTGDSIAKTAEFLSMMIPTQKKVLWRGLILDPNTHPELGITPRPEATFESWTEDIQVAKWFGSPDTIINIEMRKKYPDYKGYMSCTYIDELPDFTVLWHHNWKKTLEACMKEACARTGTKVKNIGDLVRATNRSKTQQERSSYVKQTNWALCTQKEVILSPTTNRVAIPTYLLNCNDEAITTTELDYRFNIQS